MEAAHKPPREGHWPPMLETTSRNCILVPSSHESRPWVCMHLVRYWTPGERSSWPADGCMREAHLPRIDQGGCIPVPTSQMGISRVCGKQRRSSRDESRLEGLHVARCPLWESVYCAAFVVYLEFPSLSPTVSRNPLPVPLRRAGKTVSSLYVRPGLDRISKPHPERQCMRPGLIHAVRACQRLSVENQISPQQPVSSFYPSHDQSS